MIDDIVIREANKTDFPQILPMLEDFIREVYDNDSSMVPLNLQNLSVIATQMWRWLTNKEDGVVIVADDNDKIVGLCASGDWNVQLKYDLGRVAHDLAIYICKDYRNLNIAADMHKLEQKILKNRGFNAVFCGVQHGNEKARKSIERDGFIKYQDWYVKKLEE